MLFAILIVSSACMPEQAVRRDFSPTVSNNTGNDVDNTGGTTPTITQLPEPVNFLQMGTSKYLTNLPIFSDYNDSIILRGNELNAFLKDYIQNNPTNLCMAIHFPDSSGASAKKVLVLAARIRNYINPELAAREYFLQMEVSNESANVADCMTISLNNTLSQTYSTSSYAYKISDVCPSCNSSILSNGVKVFDSAGASNLNLNTNHLRLSMMPPLGSTASGNSPTCSSDSACSANGYDCCILGQCVNHAEIKAGVDQNSTAYTAAVQQILARPELIANYTDYFYVCPTMVPTNPNNDQTDPDLDPIQQAADLFSELQDLYRCLNPVIDEFSICTKEYENVTQLLAAGGGSHTFFAGIDDLTFASINPSLTYNNITGLEYAGVKIYESKLYSDDLLTALNPSYGSINPANDVLSTGQSVLFKMPAPANAINDTLKVRYRVDGTCKKIGSTIAKCTKYYKQGQSSNPPRSSDHISGQNFRIPSYANTSYNVIVEVGGTRVGPGVDTWTLSSSEVIFNAAQFPIYDNQEVKIEYFVTTNISTLLQSTLEAQAKVDEHCACGEGISCNLQPVYSEVAGVSTLTSYACLYPQPDVPEPPLQKTIFMSARSVAHKFFDANGVHYEYNEISSNYQQECALGGGDETGCNLFQYSNGDESRPNNQNQYIGFSEILGSFNTSEKSPIPATKVDVVKGRYYDLFTDEGVFSSCLSCGTDYYSNIQKIFPDNFMHKGGGYLPDTVESRRLYNQGSFNADDMKFGRACFVPPTMIPWTHDYRSNVTDQRRARLKAQHFLFANGYNKDWYGFDYGSLIGSFDGVKWFSVGNQRRIQAKSNKLYLAVNGYFGDVTAANTFRVTISETASVVNSGSVVTHDSDSDGAQCQRQHFCDTDNDCITQLGYDYTCQNVSGMTTPWPQFDSNGNEVSGMVRLSLLSLVGGSNGQVKRCVYRGRGAVCEPAAHNVSSNDSYAQTDNTALHLCSHNTYCETLDQSKFNTKISRYGISPSAQNNKTYITNKSDTFGLAARILGRPYDYYGSEAPPTGVASHLSNIDVSGICIPGKNPEAATNTVDINGDLSRAATADQILGIGKTFSNTLAEQDDQYFSACPTTDEDGNFTHFNNFNLDDADNHSRFSITQNMSTNSLDLPVLSALGLFNDGGTKVESKGYHQDTCLRAPGAKCFSDFDCSPNKFISGKIKTISNFNNEMTKAEQNFWKEELVCANSQQRRVGTTTIPNPYYELYEHRCCRETGNKFTYFTQKYGDNDGIEVVNSNGDILIPGVNQDINDPRRYSRTHTVYDKMVEKPNEYPPLYSADPTRTVKLNLNLNTVRQYNTLHLNNARMCCTGHWVREFASGTHGNNGGHKFTGSKQQSIDVAKFKPLNWFPNNYPTPVISGGNTTHYVCTGDNVLISNGDCEIKSILEGSAEEQKYLKWMGKFELLGIPQVLIETNFSHPSLDKYNMYRPLDLDQMPVPGYGVTSTPKPPLDGTIKDVTTDGIADVEFNDGVANIDMYSAASYDNFEIGTGKMKKVFSETEFSCCVPTGIEISDTVSATDCCSGTATNEGGLARCCLQSYTDVSVYTNRYVSSEGAYLNGQKVSDDDIDPTTGYIKKEIVMQMAPTMCCSGKAAYGVVISELFIPISGDGGEIGKLDVHTSRRWIDNENLDNAEGIGGKMTFFERGQKYNDHVYCIPPDEDTGSGGSGGQGGTAE